jgi:hypothetical protein
MRLRMKGQFETGAHDEARHVMLCHVVIRIHLKNFPERKKAL